MHAGGGGVDHRATQLVGIHEAADDGLLVDAAIASLVALPSRVLGPVLLQCFYLFFALIHVPSGGCRQREVCAAGMAHSNTPCGLFLRYKNKALHRLT